jgi:DNA (cytosine-5)-methyltransferase 1
MSATAPTFLSVFSGIGGFDLGLERSGWRCAGQIEVDPFCGRVLARHWPNVPRWGDVTTFDSAWLQLAERRGPERGTRRARNIGEEPDSSRTAGVWGIDLLCGGFPCQDLSIAGHRAGLSAARSGLFFEFVRLAGELRPRWILLENVPGLFSSNGGRDFALILHTLDQLRYGVSWRVLDSRYFGVPQRRRRVFLVGHLGAACPVEVLFEPEGGERDIAPGGEAGESVAGTLGGGSDRRGWCSDIERMTFVPSVAGTLGASNTRHTSGLKSEADLLAYHCQGTNVGPMGALRRGNGNETGGVPFVSPPLRAEGHDASEDGRGRRTFAIGASAVRRLTPTECELLQSFPPGWSCLCDVQPYSTADCRCPDSPRYAALGNAVTVNVITWLGQRMLSAHTERMP